MSNNEPAASDHEESPSPSPSPSPSSSREEDPTVMYVEARAWHTSDDLYYASGALIGTAEIATAVTNNNADNGLEEEAVAFMLPSAHTVDEPVDDVSPEDHAMAHVLVLSSSSSSSLPEETEKEGKEPTPYLHDLIRTRDWPGALQWMRSHPEDARYLPSHHHDSIPHGQKSRWSTPLHHACRAPISTAVLRELIPLHVQAVLSPDAYGNTPLHLLLLESQPTTDPDTLEVLPYFLQNNMSSSSQLRIHTSTPTNNNTLLVLPNDQGQTPLHALCGRRRPRPRPRTRTQQQPHDHALLWKGENDDDDEEEEVLVRITCAILDANPSCRTIPNPQTGATPLLAYCQSGGGNLDIVKLLAIRDTAMEEDTMEQSGNITMIPNHEGCLPLHYAARHAHFHVVQFFLDQDQQRKTHMSPSQREVEEDTHYLYGSMVNHLDSQKRCPLHMAAMFQHSQHTVANSNHDRHHHDHGERSLFLSSSQVRTIEYLLWADPSATSRTDRKMGRTPLHYVCASVMGGKATYYAPPLSRVMQRLLHHMTLEDITKLDYLGYSVLHYICEHCDVPALPPDLPRQWVSLLLKAATTTTTTDSKPSFSLLAHVTTRNTSDTPLHLACSSANTQHSIDMIQLLLEAYPQAVALPNVQGLTPIHLACRCSLDSGDDTTDNNNNNNTNVNDNTHILLTMLRLLIAAHKRIQIPGSNASVVMLDNAGDNPLHKAFCARGASPEVITLLAQSYPEWIHEQNHAGYTPLHLACKMGECHATLLQAFQSATPPPTERLWSVTNVAGHGPLHSACHHGTTGSTNGNLETIRFILEAYPASLYMKTQEEDTPLHLACLRKCHPTVVGLIAESCVQYSHNHNHNHIQHLDNKSNKISTILTPNARGNTPLTIAMHQYRSLCDQVRTGCCVTRPYTKDERQMFDTISVLLRVLHYGSTSQHGSQPLLHTALSTQHRFGNSTDEEDMVDPVFIRRIIHFHPEELSSMDTDGNMALHVGASQYFSQRRQLYVSKRWNHPKLHTSPNHEDRDLSEFLPCIMLTGQKDCSEECRERSGLLGELLQMNPEAAKHSNVA
eukprot:scaffold40142_cov63-Attheya_sp.AAC.1